jgi:hypothetical protein
MPNSGPQNLGSILWVRLMALPLLDDATDMRLAIYDPLFVERWVNHCRTFDQHIGFA